MKYLMILTGFPGLKHDFIELTPHLLFAIKLNQIRLLLNAQIFLYLFVLNHNCINLLTLIPYFYFILIYIYDTGVLGFWGRSQS